MLSLLVTGLSITALSAYRNQEEVPMKKTLAAIMLVGALLAGCATPTPAPIASPTPGALAPTATTVPPTEAPTPTTTIAPTATPTATPILEPTSTPTPIPTYTLSGTVYFDYNGNGLQDEGEPPIEGVPISVAGLSTTSGPDGSYSIAGVPAGSQQVYVESPTQEPATAFRYISLSLEAFQRIQEPIALTVSGNTGLNIALMQGFLTLPFSCQYQITPSCYFDVDPGPGLRTYLGDTTECIGGQIGTADGHGGTDWDMPVGTPLYAMGPGVVEIGANERGEPWVKVHLGGGMNYLVGHLSQYVVAQGSTVKRGEMIAMSGPTTGFPHLDARLGNPNGWLDFYRDTLTPGSVSYWTVDNNPQCLP